MRPYDRRLRVVGALVVSAAFVMVLATHAWAASADHRLVRAGLLRSADVGDSWQPSGDRLGPRFGPPQLTDCSSVTRATQRNLQDSGVSALFTNGDASVSNSVIVYRSPGSAASAFAAVGGDAAISCVRSALLDRLANASASASASAISIASTTPPRIGDQRLALSVEAQGATGDGRVGVKATLVVVRIGRAVVGATFAGSTLPPSDAVERTLLPSARRLVARQHVAKGPIAQFPR